MNLSKIKKHLENANAVNFQLPDGTFVPQHFHVTEVGIITKNFIDCGGRLRSEKSPIFSFGNANDTEHRLKPGKLLNIIALSEKILGMEDLEVEVEYQSDTIGKYGIDYNGENFVLTAKQTDCLAKDNCGVPKNSENISLSMLGDQEAEKCCTPGGKCC